MENDIEINKIKENLYSRQIGTYGEDTMKKIINLKILILGMKGIGVEVAKNIILTGPEKVVIYDPEIVELKDLGSNYYLTEGNINNRIDYSSLPFLTELNQYTEVEVLNIKSVVDFYTEIDRINFDVIVQTELKSKTEIFLLDEYCRKKKLKFIYGTDIGLSGFIFSDFGDNHIILDQNGIEPKKFLCKDITNDQKGLVSIVDEFNNPFNLDTDDYVVFKNVRGMTELNDNKPRKINIIEDNIFSIDEDTTNYHKFEGNGDIYEYKNPFKKQYMSFKESINLPFNKKKLDENITEQQENKLHKNILYLSIIIAISEYLDNPDNDIKELKKEEIVIKISNNAEIKFNEMIQLEMKLGLDYEGYEENEIQQFDKNIAHNIIKFSQFKIIPICSIIGGYISQEIIKVTGKYTPINQWLFFDLYDHNYTYGIKNNIYNINNRYHDLISIFGETIQEKLQKLKIFVSGAGAVGCELLKNFALMGISTDKNGLLIITDYDNIENSNLNRQFLFNKKNVNESKSTVACEAIRKMNKNINCKDLHQKVCKESENYFDENFWKNQDIIISAVDNDDSRSYLNDKCFKYDKILMNVGTSGVRAKADIIIPKITFPLKLDINTNKNEINMCTVKKFPSNIEHCVQWSNDLFINLFNNNIETYNKFLSNKDGFIKQMTKDPDDVFLDKYYNIKTFIDILDKESDEKKNYRLLVLSINYFYILFIKSIKNLLLIYPPDKTDNGNLFWSGSRKKPSPFDLINPNDKMTKQFLYSFCFIYSNCLKIKFINNIFEDNDKLNIIVQNIYKEIICKNKIISLNEIERNKIINEMIEIKSKIINNTNINWIINSEKFEKDGLNNNHIEFIQSSANLRARNYNIVEESKNKILMISGKIIPSVPTSTSTAVGYLCLQIINLMYTKDTQNVIKNAFFHLGLNVFDLIPQEKIDEYELEENKKKEENNSNYTDIEIKKSMTRKEFLDYMFDNYKIEVIHFEINNKILYDKRVTKDPRIIKRETEKNQEKIEDLYFEQIGRINEIINEKKEKILMIKLFCRIKNEDKNTINYIYNFPLVKYIFN